MSVLHYVTKNVIPKHTMTIFEKKLTSNLTVRKSTSKLTFNIYKKTIRVLSNFKYFQAAIVID